MNQDQDVIQIDNNMETIAMAKEKNRFSEGSENLRGCGQPQKVEPSTDKACCAKQIVRKDNDV